MWLAKPFIYPQMRHSTAKAIKPSHSAPQRSEDTHWDPGSAAEPFQSLAKRGCCCWQPAVAALACNESPPPEGTGWDHPLMVCQPSAYPCENKTFITHMRTGYEQMTQKSGGFQVLLPSAWVILLSHETCCDIFCVGCRVGVENNPKPTLSFSPKIMYNSFNWQIKEKNYHERGKCGSKGKASLLNIRSSFEFQHISEWIIFFNLFNYVNSHHALVVLAVFSLYMYDSRIAIATRFLISLQLRTINTIRQGQCWSKSWSKLCRF